MLSMGSQGFKQNAFKSKLLKRSLELPILPDEIPPYYIINFSGNGQKANYRF